MNTLWGLPDRVLLETMYATAARREKLHRMDTEHLDLEASRGARRTSPLGLWVFEP